MLLWKLVLCIVAAVVLLYLLHPELWSFLAARLHAEVERWRRSNEERTNDEQQQTTKKDVTTEEDSKEATAPEEEEDVVEYTPPGSSGRVRLLHARTPEALQRLLAEGKTDPKLLTQTTVTSSVQYPDVSVERPMVVNTYRA